LWGGLLRTKKQEWVENDLKITLCK